MPKRNSARKLPDIMTLDEVAAYLKVTTRTIYRMLEEDQIPAFKVRGTWRFRGDEIEKLTKGEISPKRRAR